MIEVLLPIVVVFRNPHINLRGFLPVDFPHNPSVSEFSKEKFLPLRADPGIICETRRNPNGIVIIEINKAEKSVVT